MRHILSLSLLLSVFLLADAQCAPPRSWTGKVVGVFDGDTLTIHAKGATEIIRLRGVDCPEEDQSGGIRAKEFTTKMVLGKTAEVFPFFTDNFGRTVAHVFIEGKSLGDELLKAGLAEKSMEYPSEEKTTVIERLARLKKMAVGLLFMGLVEEAEK